MSKEKKLNDFIEILEELKVELKKEYKASVIGIFGSYVRNLQDKNSDIDILARFDKDANLIDFVGLANFLEDRLGVKVDIVPTDAIREELKDSILKEAVYI